MGICDVHAKKLHGSKRPSRGRSLARPMSLESLDEEVQLEAAMKAMAKARKDRGLDVEAQWEDRAAR